MSKGVFVPAASGLAVLALLAGSLGATPAFAQSGQAKPVAQTTPATSPAPVIMAANGATLPSLADIVQRVSPAVVSLIGRKGLGSGFVIDADGYIVTNNHVVVESTEVEVRFADGTKYTSRLVGRDEATDIALLKIDAPRKFPSVRVIDDRGARVGDWVLAVGNPFGLGGTVTAGIISARGRDEVGRAQFTDYLQLDAAINPGNSGGPTFDMGGRVIGMNTLGFVSNAGERATGIGFAIPSSTILRIVADLRTSGTVSRGFLGVQIESLSDEAAKALGLPNSNGALVTDVIDGSPAQKAGIKRGDVILRINGIAVKDNRELSRRIAALEVGQNASFTIWRDNKQITISVVVAKRDRLAMNDGPTGIPNAQVKYTSLGLGLQSITDEVRSALALKKSEKGVLIVDVDTASDAAAAGLRAGDRIIAVGSEDVGSLTDVNLAIEQARALKRTSVLLFVVTQQGGRTHMPVKLNEVSPQPAPPAP